MSLLRGFNQEDYTGWIRAKMVNKWHSRYSTNRSWKNNRSTGWNYSRRRRVNWTQEHNQS